MSQQQTFQAFDQTIESCQKFYRYYLEVHSNVTCRRLQLLATSGPQR